MDDKFRSRKFLLAAFALFWSTTGMLFSIISGGEYVSALVVILGLYGASNHMERKNDL
jgi:hypothetical protein